MKTQLNPGDTFTSGSWSDQMTALAQVMRDRGRDIPEGASVRLETVPKEERDENGLPLFRCVVVEADPDDEALSTHLNADLPASLPTVPGLPGIPVVGTVDAETGDISLFDGVRL